MVAAAEDKDKPAAVLFRTDAQDAAIRDYTSTGGSSTYSLVDPNEGTWYQKARIIRQDPTVALARAILAALHINNDWSIVGDNEEEVELIKKTILPYKLDLLRSAVFSGIDYGWQTWEVRPWYIPGVKEVHMKYKALRHDFTRILTDKNGFPTGIKNNSLFTTTLDSTAADGIGDGIEVNRPYAVFAAAGEEYGNPYGYALLKNVEAVMDRYNEVEDGAARYVNRVAGSHWVLWYPDGQTVTVNGEEVESGVIAGQILDKLRASGSVALPVSQAELNALLSSQGAGGDVKKSGWDIKLITDGGGIDPFLERERYLDALKMRGVLIPERTSLEGQFGTKAESAQHADVAMLAIAQWGNGIIDWFNSEWGFVGTILRFNKIPFYPGRVKIVPLPLVDEEKMFFRELFRTVVNNVEGWARIIDVDEVSKRTNVPLDKKVLEELKKQPVQPPEPQNGDGNTDPKLTNKGQAAQK